MTNKIEISRELAEVFARGSDYTCAQMMGAIQQVRALLAAPAVERKSVPVVGMLIDGVVHYFKDEHLVSESGAIVPEADELYRKSPAVERQEPAFYAQYGHSEYSEDWRGVIKKEFDRRNGYTVPLYTSPPAPVAVVHFVCDRIPDQTGCTFIECEDATGSSIDAGKWEVRPDGLAQLVISRAPINLPEYKRPPPGCVITQEMAAHNACLDKVKEMNQ